MATCCIVGSSRSLVRLHAHNVITCQPLARSISSFRRSRSRLRSIFACQNAVFVFGSTNSLHPSCPCQKQPLTNIAVLYLRITISGLPGTLLTFSRYLYPCAHRHFGLCTPAANMRHTAVALLRCQNIGHSRKL